MLGYKNNKPRNWYIEQDTDTTSFTPETEKEKALDILTPDGDRDLFKSHLERGGETQRPHEVMIERITDDSFYREAYTRKIDDLNTADATLQEVRNAEYTVELMQGNSSASAHRYDTIDFNEIPDKVKKVFKTHDDKNWMRR